MSQQRRPNLQVILQHNVAKTGTKKKKVERTKKARHISNTNTKISYKTLRKGRLKIATFSGVSTSNLTCLAIRYFLSRICFSKTLALAQGSERKQDRRAVPLLCFRWWEVRNFFLNWKHSCFIVSIPVNILSLHSRIFVMLRGHESSFGGHQNISKRATDKPICWVY